MVFSHQISARKLTVNHKPGSIIKEINVHRAMPKAEGLENPQLPESVLNILENEKLMNAVFGALALARNDHRASKNNDDVGVFIFSNRDSSYSFRHRGPYAADGFKGGQDFGGVSRQRVMGSSALAISVTQLESIRNGLLRSPESIKFYRGLSAEGRMPVFVKSRGDFKSMMMYHHSYEGAIQIKY